MLELFKTTFFRGNELKIKQIICSDSEQSGKWINLEFSKKYTTSQLEKLLNVHFDNMSIVKTPKGLQVFCKDEENSSNFLSSVNQLLSDIELCERITEKCIVQTETLVGGVLCHLVKS